MNGGNLRALRRICLVLTIGGCTASPRAAPHPLTGSWHGRAVFRGARLDLDVRFFHEGDSLRATMSARDLLLLEQPLDEVRYEAPRVGFTAPDEHPFRFEGTLEGDSIRGGASLPTVPGVVERGAGQQRLDFTLRRAAAPLAAPYTTRDVHIDVAGARLAATLLVPTGAGPHPGIVILQGSSTNLRRDYRFYADHFARMGLATLTFDKRGNGESSGNYAAASYDVLADDAAAAVRFMSRLPEVRAGRIGVWGLSQGAVIAPLVAARVPSLRFIVAVSPPGVTLGLSAAYQDSLRLIANGFTRDEAAFAAGLNRRIVAWLRDGTGEAAIASELARSADAPWRRASALPRRLPPASARGGWYWQGRTLDPVPRWGELEVPVLVIFGAADELLPAGVSATRIERALRAGGNADATVRMFPSANHVLRRLPLIAGGAWDWPRAAPGYLELLTRWIQDHAR